MSSSKRSLRWAERLIAQVGIVYEPETVQIGNEDGRANQRVARVRLQVLCAVTYERKYRRPNQRREKLPIHLRRRQLDSIGLARAGPAGPGSHCRFNHMG